MVRIVYSRHYNIGFYGLERFHPFDSRKYGRAWRQLGVRLGMMRRQIHVKPSTPATIDQLRLVHSDKYLQRLKDPKYVAGALELPIVRRLPSWALDWHILRPMRWATQGTILAAGEALKHGLAINLSGGYHHAKPDRGEGFSIYSDIGIAVRSLRSQKLLSEASRVVYIDTDAHQGNGVCHTFMGDPSVFIFDIFNGGIYPVHDVQARQRIDCAIPIAESISDAQYMKEIRNRLPGFLDSVGRSPIGLAIYNAGTDVFKGDPLGRLGISAATILQRDLYVVDELRKRGIPTTMVLSGGYTKQSYQLIADSVTQLIKIERTRQKN